MIKRWKELSELSELPCVKVYGIKHKIAHFIGSDNVFHCLGAYLVEGIRKGITKEEGD